MGCCCKNNLENQTRECTITFLRPELLQDIAELAYVEGDMIQGEDPHESHQLQDIVEDGNVERVTRVLDLTFAEVVELCYPYTKMQMEDDYRPNDIYRENEAYRLHLTTPATMSKTSIDYLEKLVHELLVCRVMADWTSITKPSATANWLAKAEDIRSRIVSTLMKRGKRVRRPLTPFG